MDPDLTWIGGGGGGGGQQHPNNDKDFDV